MKAYKPEEIVATFPATDAQQRCWVMEQLQPGKNGMNIAGRLEFSGDLPGDIVEAALQTVVDRHEILRTRFVERDGAPVQEVLRKVDFHLTRLDLRGIPDADHEARLQEIAREHASEPFDLSKPCLLRVAAVQLARDRTVLLICVHHTIFDGYSISALGHELGTVATAMLEGRTPSLPALPLQYGDYTMWLRDCEAAGALVDDEAYWADQLEGMRYFEVPSDHPRLSSESELGTVSRQLPADFETRMSAAARARNVSVFALGTAATSAALERFTGRQDVSLAIQVAGRNEVDLEPLIGIFTNFLVLRLDMDPNQTLSAHIGACGDVLGEALSHQSLPFDKLVRKLNPKRDPLRVPLASVMFNLQRSFLRERSFGPFDLCAVKSFSTGTMHDLTISILEESAGWSLVIDYNAGLFEQGTIEQLADLLLHLLRAVVDTPEASLSEITPSRTGRSAPPEAKRPDSLPATAPDNATTRSRLAAIWAEVLALPESAVDGNFFELGGYSVLALRMLAKTEEAFGFRPHLVAFLSDPTLPGLAGLIDAKTTEAGPKPARCWSLVELKAAPEAPVIVSVNQTFLYESLGRQLDGCCLANISVPDRAALAEVGRIGFEAALQDAADLILDRYRGRPLMLTGLCVDGRLSLRLAQMLDARGQAVALVAMIDTWAPGAERMFTAAQLWRAKWNVRLRRLVYFLNLRRRGRIETADVLGQYRIGQHLMRTAGRKEENAEYNALITSTVDMFMEQTQTHQFSDYSGEAAIFVTRAQGVKSPDHMLGWKGLLPADTALYQIDGWHGDALMRSDFEQFTTVLQTKVQRLILHE